MAGISFLNPLFLAALAAAALPLLVHLVFRRRAVSVPFPSVRFLRLVDVRLARNRRFREILLLLLRTAVLVLCALALAKPVWRPQGAGESPAGSTAMVVVLDASASMRRAAEGRSAFDRARTAAQAALATLRRGDEAAVVFAGAPRPGGENLSRFVKDVKTRAERSSCGFGRCFLGSAVSGARELLASSTASNREIVVFTDLQAGAWDETTPQEGETPRLFIVDVSPPDRGNLAVSDVRAYSPPFVAGNVISLVATVTNHGAADETGSLTLRIGDRVVGEKEYVIEAGGAANIGFRHTFDEPGDCRGAFVLPRDAMTPDDVFHFTVPVGDPIAVLLVDGAPSRQAYLTETFYLRAALDLGDEEAGVPSYFRVSTIGGEKLVRTDLSDFVVVVLANLRSPAPRAAKAIDAFVSAGGGLLLFPGDRTAPKALDRAFSSGSGGVLPARIASLEGAGDEPLRIETVDFGSDLFRPFKAEANMDFGTASFFRYVLLEPRPGATVLARFSNNAPAVISRVAGQGRVLQFASTCDLDWNNLPTRTVYLPLLYQAVCTLAGVGRAPVLHYRVGDAISGAAGLALSQPSAKTALPVGSETPLFEEPGIHVLSGPPPRSPRTLAANVPPSESALKKSVAADLSTVAGMGPVFVKDPAILADTLLSFRHGVELSAWLFALAVLLMLCEVAVANRSLWRRAAPRSAGVQSEDERKEAA